MANKLGGDLREISADPKYGVVSTNKMVVETTTCPTGQRRSTTGATTTQPMATTTTKAMVASLARTRVLEKVASPEKWGKAKLAKAANPEKSKVVEKAGNHSGLTKTKQERIFAATTTLLDARRETNVSVHTSARYRKMVGFA